jgi:hypothetical protein
MLLPFFNRKKTVDPFSISRLSQPKLEVAEKIYLTTILGLSTNNFFYPFLLVLRVHFFLRNSRLNFFLRRFFSLSPKKKWFASFV